MEKVRVSFGGNPPQSMTEYLPQRDGFAEVWLYDNLEQTEDGEYIADGVFLRTQLSEEEVESNRERYFASNESDEEVTISDLVDLVSCLADIVLLGGDE